MHRIPAAPNRVTVRRYLLWFLLPVWLCCIGCSDDDDSRATTTPAPIACPASVELRINGAAVDLDLGSTGIGHDVPFHEGIVLSLAADCDVAAPKCGECTLTQSSAAASRPRRRCADDSRRVCETAVECLSGSCIDLMGPPLPITTGGVASCTRNEIVTIGPGTFAPAAGSVRLPLTLRWMFFVGIDVGVPCPLCSGTALGTAGTCAGGSHDGETCVVDATDQLFGNTSYDCPPNPGAQLGFFDLPMELTSATSRLEPATTCIAEPFLGLPCYCPDQPIANFCTDGLCEVGSDGDGTCSTGPIDGLCRHERFRGCLRDADCPAAGDACAFTHRKCSSEARSDVGNVTALERTGLPDPLNPVLVSTFCVPAATSASPNQGIGLPGPAAIRLPVTIETRASN